MEGDPPNLRTRFALQSSARQANISLNDMTHSKMGMHWLTFFGLVLRRPSFVRCDDCFFDALNSVLSFMVDMRDGLGSLELSSLDREALGVSFAMLISLQSNVSIIHVLEQRSFSTHLATITPSSFFSPRKQCLAKVVGAGNKG